MENDAGDGPIIALVIVLLGPGYWPGYHPWCTRIRGEGGLGVGDGELAGTCSVGW